MKYVYIILGLLIIGGAFLFYKSDKTNTNMTQNENVETKQSPVTVTPISHASAVLKWDDKIIYMDPVGEAEDYASQPKADIILITDIHQDHFDPDTISAVSKESTTVVVPQAVFNLLKTKPNKVVGLVVLNNGEKIIPPNFSANIEAMPMYNLPEKTDAFHTKGRGNGYLVEKDGFRVYIAGDTEGIPEMRALTDIDIAFVPMNLPYTMSVQDAAEAVLAFKPKQVWPYHYRGPDGLSDVGLFKSLVNAGNPSIEVVLGKWY
ncbi:MAG: metal-dependent hydrolase [Parcubacteria group bacterium Gr01-1014_46]|nr:MAG: metal-dependent hydrolase [Parcubacteria group bacterium Gr01-1014_46]